MSFLSCLKSLADIFKSLGFWTTVYTLCQSTCFESGFHFGHIVELQFDSSLKQKYAGISCFLQVYTSSSFRSLFLQLLESCTAWHVCEQIMSVNESVLQSTLNLTFWFCQTLSTEQPVCNTLIGENVNWLFMMMSTSSELKKHGFRKLAV